MSRFAYVRFGLMLGVGLLLAGGGRAGAQTATAGTPVNFGTVTVGSSSTMPVSFTVTSGGTVGFPVVVTQGAQNLDFTFVQGGTCVGTVSTGTCAVSVKFAPQAPGVRMGAVNLKDNSGNTLATTLVYGVGSGPAVTLNATQNVATAFTGFGSPAYSTVDAAGNFYFVDHFNDVVEEIPAGCAVSTCIITKLTTPSSPSGIAIDGAGNVFVGSSLSGYPDKLEKYPPGCTYLDCAIQIPYDIYYNPQGMSVDGAGNR